MHTPLGRPVEPEVYITYARLSAVVAVGGGVAGKALIAAASASIRITGAAPVGDTASPAGNDAPSAPVVSTAATSASASMKLSRSAGAFDSSGRYAAPAFSTASIATTRSLERSSSSPTTRSGVRASRARR